MTRILAFAGRKQSGKNSACSFLHGYQMRCYNLIEHFEIDEDGRLLVNATFTNAEGENETSAAVLDTTRTDLDFGLWAAENMWPYIKHYSFAGALKEICNGLFGLERSQCYGTDEQKNSETFINWEDMPGYDGDKTGKMSAREFMQYFGTDVCRKIHPDIWTEHTIKTIRAEEPLIAVISDCRFQNEVDAVQRAGGKVIRLTRGIDNDTHSSEAESELIENYDATIDNKDLSLYQTNGEILSLLESWGWLGSVIEPTESKPDEDERQIVGGIMKIKE
tara:strand:+ start:9088 stop:9918 length:831 start_codon:yes stop_codon:yes gene_type:complete